MGTTAQRRIYLIHLFFPLLSCSFSYIAFHHYFGGLTQKSNPATNSPLPSSTPRTSSPSSSPTSTPRSTTSTSFVTPAGLLPSAIMMDISSYDSHSIDVLDGLKYLYRYLPSSGNNKPSGYYIFPTYTVILHVVQGDLQRITWDETCLCPETITSSSSSAVCLPNTDRMMMNNITTIMNISTTGSGNEIPTSCALPITSCTHQPTKEFPFANSCDLQLFFVWTGTDSNGQFFTSSSKRFSRFRAWPAQLTQLWESIKDTGNRIVDSINPLNRN